jgi:hypothetical protein
VTRKSGCSIKDGEMRLDGGVPVIYNLNLNLDCPEVEKTNGKGNLECHVRAPLHTQPSRTSANDEPRALELANSRQSRGLK